MTIETGFLMIVKSSGLGEGEVDLAGKLIKSFFTQMSELGRAPARMIFVNSGIFLTTEGSQVGELLQELEELGTEILTCGTCLEYYKRKDQLIVGQVTNMKETVSAMLDFIKVVTI